MLSILNAQNLAGNTALHWAALNGHLESVKVLLEEGSDPTITNQRGHDAVYEAELNDKKEVVEWVLKEGGEGLEAGLGGETDEGEGETVGEDDGMEGIEAAGSTQKPLQEQLKDLDLNGEKRKS
jgi:ankyrin repeat protein